MLSDALEEIPENTPAKTERLAQMARQDAASDTAGGYAAQQRWIGLKQQS